MSLPALKDLFARHRTGATGLWRLGQEPGRTVYFEHGNVVFAASSHPLDRLTHILVERGKLTQVQLDYAMANLNPTMSIGRNLIEMGFITNPDQERLLASDAFQNEIVQALVDSIVRFRDSRAAARPSGPAGAGVPR